MAAEPFEECKTERLNAIKCILSLVHMAKCPFTHPWPSDIVWSEQTRLEDSDSGKCFFKSVYYGPFGPCKKSQVFLALQHAAGLLGSSLHGKMDPISD